MWHLIRRNICSCKSLVILNPQQLDVDPFKCYQTWMKKSDLMNYLKTRKEREMAPQAVVDQLAKVFEDFQGVGPRPTKKKKLDQKVAKAVSPNELSLTVNLNNFKQFRAVSTDFQGTLMDMANGLNLKVGQKRFKGQDKVMGSSATKVL
jgi:hypothetical protein